MGNPTKLVPDSQIILDAPLLKVPLELIRRNFKNAQRTIDKETKAITASLNEATQKAQLGDASAEETIASIDLMIKRMQTLKRKVSSSFFRSKRSLSRLTGRYSLQIFKRKRSSGFTDPKSA
jgi:macrophage erythroblast attacher